MWTAAAGGFSGSAIVLGAHCILKFITHLHYLYACYLLVYVARFAGSGEEGGFVRSGKEAGRGRKRARDYFCRSFMRVV